MSSWSPSHSSSEIFTFISPSGFFLNESAEFCAAFFCYVYGMFTFYKLLFCGLSRFGFVTEEDTTENFEGVYDENSEFTGTHEELENGTDFLDIVYCLLGRFFGL